MGENPYIAYNNTLKTNLDLDFMGHGSLVMRNNHFILKGLMLLNQIFLNKLLQGGAILYSPPFS